MSDAATVVQEEGEQQHQATPATAQPPSAIGATANTNVASPTTTAAATATSTTTPASGTSSSTSGGGGGGPASGGTPKAKAEKKTYWYPDRTSDFREVSLGYRKSVGMSLVYLAWVPFVVLAIYFFRTNPITEAVWSVFSELKTSDHYLQDYKFVAQIVIFSCSCVTLVFLMIMYTVVVRRPVYLIDFATYTAQDENKCGTDRFRSQSIVSKWFSQESLDFQMKLLEHNGLGEETYFPDGILAIPPETTMQRAREECEQVFSGCLDELFAKTHISPSQVDILIVNCSLFNPTPSISSMIIRKYKMKSTIRSFNLSGMGCSAGIIAVDLAKDLLQRVHKNCNCVIFSHENITQNWYRGNQKGMLITNTLFRVGGCALLLSNKSSCRHVAKYKLLTTVRVHKGADEEAYSAIYQMEDSQLNKGVRLSRELPKIVGAALKTNLTILGPQVLPFSEQFKFLLSLLRRKWSSAYAKTHPPYIPDFKKAFQHFCIHAGGRAIIDGLQENLNLSERDVEPSRATLYRWGNTSSSSVWYELAFIERTGRLHPGDKIWQIAFGSGIKCNSAVWVSMR